MAAPGAGVAAGQSMAGPSGEFQIDCAGCQHNIAPSAMAAHKKRSHLFSGLPGKANLPNLSPIVTHSLSSSHPNYQ
jgi:uncharacterized protein YfaT (DUF1175 family)